ncbi:MAG: transporter substrate-binding domain-containing protein, partial [Gammaproteobacteria bacterium]|nr:transporter substrate-binding domain-containing protein [Gammaproteobacteria bacterium]
MRQLLGVVLVLQGKSEPEKSLRLILYISLAALLGTCSAQPPILDQVLDLGELRVVTRDSPTAYVDSPDGPSGPEYDLAKAFADHLGVDLVIETVQSVSEVLPRLIEGNAHMAAAGLSTMPSRREYVSFGHPYDMVDMHLVYKLGTG